MVRPSVISVQIWTDTHLHWLRANFSRWGSILFAPSFLVPELVEAPVIRGQTRMPLSGVIPGTVVCGTCPSCGSWPY